VTVFAEGGVAHEPESGHSRQTSMTDLVLQALVAFGLSLALVPACRAVAIRFGYTAKPRQDRWHSRPTALLGGVAIAVTVLAVHVATQGPSAMPLLLIGATAMFGLGLFDDLISLKPSTKLIGEIAIAALFVFFGYRLGWSDSLTVDMLLTMFWIVGLTNALNLLDNMDGLCAGIGIITGSALLAAFVINAGATPEARYLALLLGALLGFLIYNFHPASIFMGDSGSLFVGLNLAVLTLGSPYDGRVSGDVLSIIAAPVLVLLVPIFDTALVSVSRILSGRSVAQGGRDHSSHRLVAMGLSERRAVAVLWALAALGGMLALSIRSVDDGWAGLATAVFVVAMMIFAVYLSQIRVYEGADEELLRSGRITPFVVSFMHRRRVAEVLLDVGLVSIAYYAAYNLRFEGPDLAFYLENFFTSLPLVLGVQLVALFFVGAYRGVWRYYSLMDGVTFAKGVFLGTLTSIGALLYVFRFENYSRAVFVIYATLLLWMLVGSRASFRLISEFAYRRRHRGQRLVIYGAADATAATAVRELLSRSGHEVRMLGFIDDDPNLARTRMHGFPVLGDYRSLTSLIANGAVDAVVIARPLIDADRLAALQALCSEHRVSLSRLSVELSQIVVAS
jgi:UDP-GlcNAc:undecaprenyl-phosphate/decaprenyl-phosphate GlcNAc-1-phosphate transferase